LMILLTFPETDAETPGKLDTYLRREVCNQKPAFLSIR